MDIPSADLQRVRDLYHAGAYRQALAAGEAHGPLRAWGGPAARLLAGRLAIQLGAPRLGHRLHIAAYRESPSYLEAVYYHARYRLEQFGPLACWQFAQKHPDWSDAPPALRADWLAVQALAASRLRDFDRADRFLKEADGLAGDRAWLLVERSSVMELAERPADALAAARRSLEVHPWFRPGVQAVSHLLQRAGRDAEAVELLEEATKHLESGVILAHLATMRYDQRRYDDARAALDAHEQLSPLMEREVAKWLAARRADVAYALGEFPAAAQFARTIAEPFYTGFADRLEAATPDPHPRRMLSIDAQYSGTPPSAGELLGRFWNCPAPAVPADTPMVLDGVPDAAERKRYTDAGWVTAEFTLTESIGPELIARGVPFLVTMVEAGFTQPRLVVGADPVRASLHMLDGTERRPNEAPLSVLLERYKAFGPRCLVAVPAAEAHRLEGLTLPDADAFDALHLVLLSLNADDTAEAKRHIQALNVKFPEHRVAKVAAIAWARATSHPVLLLDALTALLADYPHEPSLSLAQAAVYRDLGRMPERKAVLAAEGTAANAEPLLMQSYAQMLLLDPDKHLEADRLLRRSIRNRPPAAPGYYLLATLRWENQRFDEAVELYRFAACLDDREEQFAESFAKAARARGRSAEALRLFQQRANRDARPFAPAVKALYQTLHDRDELDFATSALDKAIEKLRVGAEVPDSSLADLLLFRAEARASQAKFAEAQADLAEAKPHAAAVAWHRSAVRVARLKPDYTQAHALTKAVARLDAGNADAHRLLAASFVEVEGREAARRYLAGVAQRHPDDYALAKLYAEFVYPDQDDAAVAVTRGLLDLCPHDAWAFRQLAMLYADRKSHDQALDAMNEAAASEPTHPSHYAVLAHVHRRADRLDDALTTLRDGIERYPDHELAIFELVQLSPGEDEKRGACEFVAEQLHRYPHTGDGLLALSNQAADLISDPEQLEDALKEAQSFLDERPDLWQAWSAVGQLLVTSHRADEGATLAEEATERFPLVARVWIDLALASRAAERPEERVEALRQAATVAPAWVPAVRELAEALTDAGQQGEAVEALERLVVRAPTDALARWILAEKLWAADRGREALDQAKLAVRLDSGTDPRVETAWSAVLAWSDRLGVEGEALELAKALTVDRAGDPRAWLRYARAITDMGQAEEMVQALDTAIRLDPRNVEAYDLKAERLAAIGRFDEALLAARPEALAEDLPLVLQGRAAWVEARRGNYAAAIPPMQALVAVDPDYIWGWQQLAEWYNDTGRSESYLEAASEFLRLRPDHPTSLTMRGEARLQTGDREGGKADLRDALKLHPGYSPAAVILFDACLADGEHREARTALAVLQEHLSGPEVVVKQVQYAARTGDGDGAARAFRDLCRLPNEGPAMFLQLAINEMRVADLTDRVAPALKEAFARGEVDEEDDDGLDDEAGFNPWAPLFWLDTPDGQLADEEEQLAACEALIEEYPDFIPGHDRHAEQLAEMERYDDAKAACRPANFPPPYPVALRGRFAWVEAHAGNVREAVALMKTVLDAEPDYSWGWRQITHWYEQLEQPRDGLEAAERLVRLTPGDPMAHVFRGDARRKLGDNRGARADYQRAFEIDPSFQAAGLQLIATQLETDDLPGAARSLAVLQEHADGALVKLRAVQVAARQGNLDLARSTVRQLLAEPSAGRDILADALSDFETAGWAAEADDELDTAVREGAATPTAASLWVDTRLEAGEGEVVADRLSELVQAHPEAGREAVLTYLFALANSDRKAEVSAAVQRFSEMLRAKDVSWARAGIALVVGGHPGHAAAWLADYADRADHQPWMLESLLLAHQQLGDDAAAEAVAQDAATYPDPDDVPPTFFVWLGLYAALRGETDQADDFLEQVDPVGQGDGLRLLLTMAEALVGVQRAADKPRAFAEAKLDLKAAVDACPPGDRPTAAARFYRRVVDRLGRDAGTLRARLWALWHRGDLG